ncbi:MAG: single-stranded DNA-binding protein [Chitinophagales bacterium]|nr:single-stranded DNA-binding protein [Chitinophagales bacterium]
MKGVNKVILIGRVGLDPEMRNLDNNRSKLNIRLATTESYKDSNGEWKDITDWHNVVMWGNMAERGFRDIKKRNLIYVEGKNRTRSWEDKDGNRKYITEVIADYFQNLTPRDLRQDEIEEDDTSNNIEDTPDYNDDIF